MRPSRRLVHLLSLWAALALLVSFVPGMRVFWLAFTIVMMIAIVVDALDMMHHPAVSIRRLIPHNLAISAWHAVTLRIRNRSRRSYRLEIHDHHPATFDVEGLPGTVILPANGVAEFRYRVRPRERGDVVYEQVEVAALSAFGLWRRHRFIPDRREVRVYPNFAEVAKYALLATDNRLSQMGVRHRQRRGGGKEFHQLRDYRDGDEIRSIDWKASSRFRRLIAREYQDERDQQVIFMVDCGRRMRAADNGIDHFDQTLNAMLLLSYVALRQGDAVGFLAFAGQGRWFPPHKGQGTVNRMLNRLYDLHAGTHTADFESAARELLARQRKRSLVIMLTNVRDEDRDGITAAIRLLRTRHLVLLANLREAVLDEVLDTPVEDFESALNYTATVDYLEDRRGVHRQLTGLGAIAMDVTAARLPVAVVNRYLDIKSNGIL